jgi:hypothetical protein
MILPDSGVKKEENLSVQLRISSSEAAAKYFFSRRSSERKPWLTT